MLSLLSGQSEIDCDLGVNLHGSSVQHVPSVFPLFNGIERGLVKQWRRAVDYVEALYASIRGDDRLQHYDT